MSITGRFEDIVKEFGNVRVLHGVSFELPRGGVYGLLAVALKTLADNHFGYVYSGAHAFPGPELADRFDTAKMRASPAFRLVYARDGVEIFQFVGAP
jgi:hypothetical protein